MKMDVQPNSETPCWACNRPNAAELFRLEVLDAWMCLRCVRNLGRTIASEGRALNGIWKCSFESLPPFSVHSTAHERRLEAETHADLANAFSEMGLVADSIRNAARSLVLDSSYDSAVMAFGIIFDQTKLTRGGLAQLRLLLAKTREGS